jgi:serine/threonine-protein kinase
MTSIEPGEVVGPVRLAKLLRKDSTHLLYEGRHVRLGVDVTLRLMPRASSSESFLLDARRAADARHPALVPVLDFGEYGDARYVVMARAHGQTLEEHLTEHEAPLPERVVLRVLWRVAEALEILHDAGLAHGSIRPSSVVMDARGQLRVTDLAFVAEPPAAPDVGREDGRSLYDPPEAGAAEEASDGDARGRDLFALGVIAYEAIFRSMPYGPSASADLLSGAGITPPRFDGAAGYAPALLEVVESLIAPDPQLRIRSAQALLRVLPPFPEPPRSGPGATTPAAPPAPAQTQAPAHDSELVSILHFLQRRFGSRKTQQAEGAVVHSSLRERVIVWLLLILLLTGTVLALLPD